jgi:membrane protease YdiL (CAAX protease family)
MTDVAEPSAAPLFPRWMVLTLGGITLLVFGAGGVALITLVQSRDLLSVLVGPSPVWLQVAWGLGAGLGIGLGARALIRRPAMRALDERFARLLGPRVQRVSDRLFLSVCAGVGEELFFRGALQFWLGIPLTALLFVAIHGYLDPRDRRMLVYGLFMTVGMMVIGLLANAQGLLAPMLAHTVIDIILFQQLVRTFKSLPVEGGGS